MAHVLPRHLLLKSLYEYSKVYLCVEGIYSCLCLCYFYCIFDIFPQYGIYYYEVGQLELLVHTKYKMTMQ